MSNRKFTFLDNIFWLHYGINVFHFQNRWQMIIFYMVSRQNEFSFIVKQSTQPDLFLSQTFNVYKTFMNIAIIHINSVTSYKYVTVLMLMASRGSCSHLPEMRACCWQGESLASSTYHFWG